MYFLAAWFFVMAGWLTLWLMEDTTLSVMMLSFGATHFVLAHEKYIKR